MTNITFGDCPSSPVGNPPEFDFEIACWIAGALGARVFPRATPDHLAVIRTSNGRAFDDALPASGRSAATLDGAFGARWE
jgi:hypothetical protein